MSNWIKMRKKLLTDPRVMKTSRTLRNDRHAVIGALFHLWTIGDDHGGHLPGYDAEAINQIIGVPGFAEALPPEWIEITPDGVNLPSYEAHNGSTAKKRAQSAARQQAARDRESNADSVTNVTPEALPEKRREDKKNTTTKPRKRGKFEYSPEFEEFWEHYPRKKEKPKAFGAWQLLSAEQRAKALDYVPAFREAWDTYDPDKQRRHLIVYPERWLGRHCWDDDPEEWVIMARGK